MKKTISLLLAVLILCTPLCISAAESENELVVIAFGDSITAADKWQKYIEKEYGIDIVNAGVGGDSTHTAMARFKKDVLDKNPDIVFISLGTNDAAIDMAKYTPIDEYKTNMEYFISECKKIGARVLVNIPTPVVDEIYLTRHEAEPFEIYGGPNGLLSLYAEAAREAAVSQNVPYADINEMFLTETKNYTIYFPDGVHPNDVGYKLYADCVLDVYERLWLGDVNVDGSVNQYDYILVKRKYFDTVKLDERQLVRADVNCDGEIDQYDYILVKRAYFGTVTLLGN